MKWGYGILLVLILCSVLWAYPFAVNRLSERGVIYQSDETYQTAYPGYGKVSEAVSEHIFVNPAGEPVFFDQIQNRDKYKSDKYEVMVVPAQEKVSYIVGSVLYLQKIAGSEDEYLWLYSKSGIERYRISYVGREASVVAIERISSRDKIEKNKVETVTPARVDQIGKAVMHKSIKRGDSVVLTLQWELPRYSKLDVHGVEMIEMMILRRGGGADEWKQEVEQIEGKV